jgi:hypothetical protein
MIRTITIFLFMSLSILAQSQGRFNTKSKKCEKCSSVLLLYSNLNLPPTAVGTCFFIKAGMRSLLVTNFHVINGDDAIRPRSPFEKITLMYHTRSGKWKQINLNLAVINRNYKAIDITNSPEKDVFFYEIINEDVKQAVVYINDFIAETSVKQMTNSAFYAGIHFTGFSNQTFTLMMDSVKGQYTKDFHFLPTAAGLGKMTNEDSKRLGATGFIIKGGGTKGNSGSPVFAEVKNSDGTLKTAWIGMVARGESGKWAYAITAKQVMSLINESFR